MYVRRELALFLWLLLFSLVVENTRLIHATILSSDIPPVRGVQPIVSSVKIYGNVTTLSKRLTGHLRFQDTVTSNILTLGHEFIQLDSPAVKIVVNLEGQLTLHKKSLPPKIGLLAFSRTGGDFLHDLDCIQVLGIKDLCLLLANDAEEMKNLRLAAPDLITGALIPGALSAGSFIACLTLRNMDSKNFISHPFESTHGASMVKAKNQIPEDTADSRSEVEVLATNDEVRVSTSVSGPKIEGKNVFNQSTMSRKPQQEKAPLGKQIEKVTQVSATQVQVTQPLARLELVLRDNNPGIYFGSVFSYGYLLEKTKFIHNVITIEDGKSKADVTSNRITFANPQLRLLLNPETGHLIVEGMELLKPNIRAFIANTRKKLTFKLESRVWPVTSYVCIAKASDSTVTTAMQANAIRIIQDSYMLNIFPRGSLLICAQIIKSQKRNRLRAVGPDTSQAQVVTDGTQAPIGNSDEVPLCESHKDSNSTESLFSYFDEVPDYSYNSVRADTAESFSLE